MCRLVELLRSAWRARIPDAVGTPAGASHPLVPAWPFLVVAGASLVLSGIGFADGVFNWRALLPPVVAAVPALVVHRRPLAAAAWCVAANLATAVTALALTAAEVAPPWSPGMALPQLATAYPLGLAQPGPVAACAVAVIVLSGAATAGVAFADGTPVAATALPVWSAVLVVAGLLGALHRERYARSARLVAESERRRVRDERDRIARELHDVVSHHLSVIAVRSSSATRRLPDVPEASAAEFAALGAAAREALGEMRLLLHVLHDSAEPALDDLLRVVERTRAAGTPVELSATEPPALPAAAAAATIRIVQEGLSNVMRHATGADTRVRVAPADAGRCLLVEVENDAPPRPAATGGGSGLGLAGMRERVLGLGGTFDAAPTPSGGFLVRVRLPLPGEPRA